EGVQRLAAAAGRIEELEPGQLPKMRLEVPGAVPQVPEEREGRLATEDRRGLEEPPRLHPEGNDPGQQNPLDAVRHAERGGRVAGTARDSSSMKKGFPSARSRIARASGSGSWSVSRIESRTLRPCSRGSGWRATCVT